MLWSALRFMGIIREQKKQPRKKGAAPPSPPFLPATKTSENSRRVMNLLDDRTRDFFY
jgi:hypothetical protein